MGRFKKCPDCGRAMSKQETFDKHVRDFHDWTDMDVEQQEKGYQIEQVLGHWWAKEDNAYLYEIKWIGYKAISAIYDVNFGDDTESLEKYQKKVGWPPKKNLRYKGPKHARAQSGVYGYRPDELKEIPLEPEKTKRLLMMRKAEKCLGFVSRDVTVPGASQPTTAFCVAVQFEQMDTGEDPKELTALVDVTKFMETGKKKDLPGYEEGAAGQKGGRWLDDTPYEELFTLITEYLEKRWLPLVEDFDEDAMDTS